MLEGFPCNNLLAESLYKSPSVCRCAVGDHSKKLTPITFCKSLFE